MTKKSTVAATTNVWTKSTLLALTAISALAVLLHLAGLTKLPVFADEAIYIRWAQLILDDAARYAFFALNDGKTPLFIWSLAPVQLWFNDALFAGRIVAVAVGVLQIWATAWLVNTVGGKKPAVLLAAAWTALLPFWFIHHQQALMDGLLTLWITLVMIFALKVNHTGQWRYVLLGGLSWALAWWTKIPAVLAGPGVGLVWLIINAPDWKQKMDRALKLVAMLGLGLVGFASLRLAPAFGQLFSRGGDFLYPWTEVALHGGWQQTLPNWPTYLWYFISYLTWPVLLLLLAGLFGKKPHRQLHLLSWAGLAFSLPIALLGKVVYPRYFLPTAVFWTAGAALSLQVLVERWVHQTTKLPAKMLAALLVALLLGQSLASSMAFISILQTKPNLTPFVAADRSQYLTEWSSGHGLTQTVALIKRYQAEGTLAVATEGFFGTLPDGLTMYFHNQDVTGLYIDGIGQPVQSIPPTFVEKAKPYHRVLLVVNSHRLRMQLDPTTKVAEYCRPFGAPCLQVWDITNVVRALP